MSEWKYDPEKDPMRIASGEVNQSKYDPYPHEFIADLKRQLATVTAERDALRVDADKWRIAAINLRNEIENFATWRKDALDYDSDMGNVPREFCEDIELIERSAKLQVELFDAAIDAARAK